MSSGLFRVGLKEKSVRACLTLSAVKRYLPDLALKLCHPEGSIAREFIVDFNGYLYKGTTRNRLDWCVFFLKNFAEAEARLIEETASFVRRQGNGFVCYDIGANIGVRTLTMARIADRVIATEPIRLAFAKLEERVRLNGLDHVDLLNIALAETSGLLDYDLVSPANHFAVRKNAASWHVQYGTEVAQARPGDDLITQDGLPLPHFIRISAGHDLISVLRGLAATLEEARPVILIECLPRGWGDDISEFELRSCLYQDAEIVSFNESVLDGSFSFEPLDRQAAKVVCYSAALARLAQMEACKMRSLKMANGNRH
ncbi:MAG: FkbM family methyltransferase [Geminicoccaceae bacterium]